MKIKVNKEGRHSLKAHPTKPETQNNQQGVKQGTDQK
jgi:hypothetical protein